MLLKLLILLPTITVDGINHLCLMIYSKTESYSVNYSSANCAVKYVYTVLLSMLIFLYTSAVEGINHLCLMKYSSAAKLQYTLIKCKPCC